MFDAQIAVAKTNKYASRESGDTVEVVERPHGGLSVVLADGQGSGRAAKNISHLVTARAISMLKDGVRDGAVARAVHDSLFAMRGGKVSATLIILSVDLASRSLLITRNSHCPVLLWRAGENHIQVIEDLSSAIGIYAMTKPVITELPLEPHTHVVTFSDGLMEAGRREGNPIDLPALMQDCIAGGNVTARGLADSLLASALEKDTNRPADDMTALVLSILPTQETDAATINPQVRRMEIHIPI